MVPANHRVTVGDTSLSCQGPRCSRLLFARCRLGDDQLELAAVCRRADRLNDCLLVSAARSEFPNGSMSAPSLLLELHVLEGKLEEEFRDVFRLPPVRYVVQQPEGWSGLNSAITRPNSKTKLVFARHQAKRGLSSSSSSVVLPRFLRVPGNPHNGMGLHHLGGHSVDEPSLLSVVRVQGAREVDELESNLELMDP